MRSFLPWATLSRVGRGGHLGQLHRDLAALGDRVRASVAEAIGRALGGAARQTVLSLLGNAPADLTTPSLPATPSSRPRPLWQSLDDRQERSDSCWREEQSWEQLDEEYEEVDSSLPAPDRNRNAAVPPARPWRPVLAIGLQAVGWWLWRQAGRWPVRAALGFGLACGLALLVGGARIENETGLALTLFTDAIRAAASV